MQHLLIKCSQFTDTVVRVPHQTLPLQSQPFTSGMVASNFSSQTVVQNSILAIAGPFVLLSTSSTAIPQQLFKKKYPKRIYKKISLFDRVKRVCYLRNSKMHFVINIKKALIDSQITIIKNVNISGMMKLCFLVNVIFLLPILLLSG